MATQKSTLLSSFDFFAPPILLENVQVNFNATFSPYIEEKWWRQENQICELMGLVGISRKHKMEHIASLKVILFMLIRVIKQINKKSFSNSLLFFISFTLIFQTETSVTIDEIYLNEKIEFQVSDLRCCLWLKDGPCFWVTKQLWFLNLAVKFGSEPTYLKAS